MKRVPNHAARYRAFSAILIGLIAAGVLPAFYFILGGRPVHAEPFPRVAAYAGHSYDGRPLTVTSNGAPDTLVVRRLARYPTITLEVSPWYSVQGTARADIPQMLRRFNPKISIYAYHLGSHWFIAPDFVLTSSDVTFKATWHRAIQATGGWLWTTTGVVKPYFAVDWSKRATADTLTSLLCGVARSGIFDGMFLDCWSWSIAWASGGSNPPADFRRAGWFSLAQMDSALQANMRRAIVRIRAAAPPGFPIVFNGTGEQPWTDGSFREGYPDYLTTFDQAERWAEFAGPEAWLQGGSNHTTLGPAESQRAARFNIGTGCILGVRTSFGNDRRWEIKPYYGTLWPAEASVVAAMPDTTAAGVGWLGEPLGPARRFDSGLWRRDFWGGCVLLNPGGLTLFYPMPSGLTRLGGATVTGTVSVPPRDAVFLWRVR